jgi:hypothetical protein
VGRNKKKEQQVRKQSAQRETGHGEQVNTPAPREQESAFNKAVKEAGFQSGHGTNPHRESHHYLGQGNA